MKETLISVKGGGVNVTHVRDLRGTVEREAAAIGVLLCMEEPTRPMLREAADAGFYTSPAGTKRPGLQILTVEQLLKGRKLDLPGVARRADVQKGAEGEGGEAEGCGV